MPARQERETLSRLLYAATFFAAIAAFPIFLFLGMGFGFSESRKHETAVLMIPVALPLVLAAGTIWTGPSLSTPAKWLLGCFATTPGALAMLLYAVSHRASSPPVDWYRGDPAVTLLAANPGSPPNLLESVLVRVANPDPTHEVFLDASDVYAVAICGPSGSWWRFSRHPDRFRLAPLEERDVLLGGATLERGEVAAAASCTVRVQWESKGARDPKLPLDWRGSVPAQAELSLNTK